MSVIRILERQLLARQAVEKAAPAAPAAAGGLLAALQAALQAEINRAVEAALAGHQEALQRAQPTRPVPSPSPDLQRRLEALEQRASAMAMPEFPGLQVERDGAGQARAINIGTQRLLVQRDAAGQIVRLVPADGHVPVTYNGRPVKPAPINRAGD